MITTNISSAKDAKNSVGPLVDTARAEPVTLNLRKG